MAAGALATWDECFQKDEADAVQHAMNLWIDKGEDYYKAECQGRPSERLGSGALSLDPDYISRKINGLGRRMVPASHQNITGFIDVAHSKLQWMVCSWGLDFAGTVLDYGEWPDGHKTLSDIEGNSLAAAVLRGLVDVCERIAGQPFVRTDAQEVKLNSVLVDCGDPSTRDTIFLASRGQRLACRLIASRGRAHHQFYLPDPRKKRVYQNCFMDMWKGLGLVVVHDACVWRERLQRSMMLPAGAAGSVDLFGVGGANHRELALQICSEKLVEKMTGQSGEMFRWTRVPGTRNHFLDCAVGNMVAATLEGLKYGDEIDPATGKEKQGSLGWKPGHRRKRGGFVSVEG
jgi:hypothetical protein